MAAYRAVGAAAVVAAVVVDVVVVIVIVDVRSCAVDDAAAADRICVRVGVGR